jgi:hypothetical protein
MLFSIYCGASRSLRASGFPLGAEVARNEIKARLNDRPLAEALASSYPTLTEGQRERLEAAIIREIAAAIRRGDSLALLKPLSDGSFEISRMVVDKAARAAAINRSRMA